MKAWADLASRHPWPQKRPNIDVVVELGTWMGKSTRFILELNPAGRIICIDHWKGPPEILHTLKHLIPVVYDCFTWHIWDHRNRVIAIRDYTISGMRQVRDAKIAVDSIYIDAAHNYDSVKADATEAIWLWPEATLIGDDWGPTYGVTDAVTEVAKDFGRTLKHNKKARAMPAKR
jgi:hypothetical protein